MENLSIDDENFNNEKELPLPSSKVSTPRRVLTLSRRRRDDEEIDTIIDIFEISVRGDAEELFQIMNEQPYLLNVKDDVGRTCLHYACAYNQFETIQMLLSFEDIEINDTDDSGATPLILAASLGFLEVVKILIKNNCNVDIRDIKGNKAFYYAVANLQDECANEIAITICSPTRRNNRSPSPTEFNNNNNNSSFITTQIHQQMFSSTSVSISPKFNDFKSTT